VLLYLMKDTTILQKSYRQEKKIEGHDYVTHALFFISGLLSDIMSVQRLCHLWMFVTVCMICCGYVSSPALNSRLLKAFCLCRGEFECSERLLGAGVCHLSFECVRRHHVQFICQLKNNLFLETKLLLMFVMLFFQGYDVVWLNI
jgi:hypothetical protein